MYVRPSVLGRRGKISQNTFIPPLLLSVIRSYVLLCGKVTAIIIFLMCNADCDRSVFPFIFRWFMRSCGVKKVPRYVAENMPQTPDEEVEVVCLKRIHITAIT